MIDRPDYISEDEIARVLRQLIGVANSAAPTLTDLGTSFGAAPLVGKRVAIVSDARLGRRADQHAIAERLLSITGEDAVTIDRKFLPAWTGQLQTRFMVLSNALPSLADASGALVSRFVTLVLTNSFYGKEDKTLTARLLKELPGILNWAIEGQRRLARTGHFTQPASALEAAQQLEDLGSPIKAFLRERCELGAGYEVDKDKLFETWRAWCLIQGHEKPGTKEVFARDLHAAVAGLKVIRPRDGDTRHHAYRGIKLASGPGSVRDWSGVHDTITN
jgi:putative DNA primase/helicase